MHKPNYRPTSMTAPPITIVARHVGLQTRASGLSHLQPAHRARAGRELVRLQSHALQHRDEEIRQWIIVLRIEREMLAVLEAATCKNGRHVRGHVRVRIAEVR